MHCILVPQDAKYTQPLGEVGPKNPVVFLDVTINKINMGRVEIELKSDSVPITVSCAASVRARPLRWYSHQ